MSKIEETEMFKEMQKDFELYKSDNVEYKKKVNEISTLFNFKGEDRKLQSDFLPTYFVGDFESKASKYILMSANPGFDFNQNSLEECLKNSNFDSYCKFCRDFFYKVSMDEYPMKSKYYTSLSNLFAGLENKEFAGRKEMYEFFNNSLINIDLFPYHSKKFALPNKLKNEHKEYLIKRFNDIFEFLRKSNCKLLIFNGAIYNKILQSCFPDEFKSKHYEKKIYKEYKMRIFKIDSIWCVWFSAMMPSVALPLCNEKQKEIGNIINKECGF